MLVLLRCAGMRTSCDRTSRIGSIVVAHDFRIRALHIRCTVYFRLVSFGGLVLENKRCTLWAIVLLVILGEMESFVVSAAAKRWIGNLCYTVVSPYTFILIRITHFLS